VKGETVGQPDEREGKERGERVIGSLSHYIAMVVVSCTDQIDTHK